MKLIAAVGLASVLLASAQVPAQEHQPPPGPGHSLVYHAGLKRVVLFDTGLVPSAAGPDLERPSRLWSWDGAT